MGLRIESTSSSSSEDLVRIFLQHQRCGVLATADRAANPHAAVIYYLLDDDFSMLFATKRETQKCKNLEENPQAALAVYDEPTQTLVQVTGRTEFIEDKKIVEKVVNNMGSSSLEGSMTNVAPAEKLVAGDFVAVRIVPAVIKLAEYGFSDGKRDDLFETLLFSS